MMGYRNEASARRRSVNTLLLGALAIVMGVGLGAMLVLASGAGAA